MMEWKLLFTRCRGEDQGLTQHHSTAVGAAVGLEHGPSLEPTPVYILVFTLKLSPLYLIFAE